LAAYDGSTMQSLSDDESRQVLGEVLADQLKAILEYVSEIPGIKEDIRSIKERLTSLEYKFDMHEADIGYLMKKVA
jgi:hypothetical protein